MVARASALARWARRAALVLAICHASPSLALDIPAGPDFPRSGDECVEAYADAFRTHFKSRSCRHCDPLAFNGRGWEVRYTQCYKQCGDRNEAEFQSLTRARQACFQRAKRYAAEAEQERLRKAEGMQLGERLRQGYEHAVELTSALSSPSKFYEYAVGKASERVMASVMQQHELNPLTVEAHVHAYTITQARAGLKAAAKLRGQSDVISAIQQSSLDALAGMHARLITEFEGTMADIGRLETATYRAPAATFRPTPSRPPAPSPQQTGADECAILSSRESSDLALDEPERFERLSKECARR